MSNQINIEGRAQKQLDVSTSAAQTLPLTDGVYDVWSDVDVYIKVSRVKADDVTVETGYQILTGNTVSVRISASAMIGVIGEGAGTLSFHQVN